MEINLSFSSPFLEMYSILLSFLQPNWQQWSQSFFFLHIISLHIVYPARFYEGQPVDAPKILRDARHILETHFGVVHSTIQIETVEDGVEFLCARTTGPA